MFTSGDHAPPFHLVDTNGDRFILRDEVGFPQLLLFQGSDTQAGHADILQSLQKALPEFDQAGAQVVSISPDSIEQRKAFSENASLSFRLLSDPFYEVTAMFSVCEEMFGHNAQVSYPSTAFLLDANLMIIDVISPFHPEQIPAVLETFKQYCPKREPQVVSEIYTPPVLLIPNVFDAETCREVINIWETQGNQVSHFMRSDGDKTYGVVDSRMKIRRDHIIRDENLKAWINGFFQRRVYPEIEKCFNYLIDEYEHFKIACYDSATGGYFRQHRDNTSGGTAHRKWALSLNLNTEEYEGGYLRFPEYGPQLYKPPTGSAVVFSCSLMHEATDVTAGKRFALLSFFYGEKESRDRELYQAKYGTENYIPKEVNDQA